MGFYTFESDSDNSREFRRQLKLALDNINQSLELINKDFYTYNDINYINKLISESNLLISKIFNEHIISNRLNDSEFSEKLFGKNYLTKYLLKGK